MKTVTVSKDVYDLLLAHSIGNLAEPAFWGDGRVSFHITDETALRFERRFPNLSLAEAIERVLRAGRLS